LRKPITFGHFAGTAVLGARRAVDQQDPIRAGGVIVASCGRSGNVAAFDIIA
jgi:hypothetical protein